MTSVVAGSFVVQVMVAELDVIVVAVTAETTGGTFTVVKVKFPEVDVPLALLVDATSKLYNVPGVRPDSGME